MKILICAATFCVVIICVNASQRPWSKLRKGLKSLDYRDDANDQEGFESHGHDNRRRQKNHENQVESRTRRSRKHSGAEDEVSPERTEESFEEERITNKHFDLQDYLERNPEYKNKMSKLSTDLKTYVDRKADQNGFPDDLTDALKNRISESLTASFSGSLSASSAGQLVNSNYDNDLIVKNFEKQNAALENALKRTINKIEHDSVNFSRILEKLRPNVEHLADLYETLNAAAVANSPSGSAPLLSRQVEQNLGEEAKRQKSEEPKLLKENDGQTSQSHSPEPEKSTSERSEKSDHPDKSERSSETPVKDETQQKETEELVSQNETSKPPRSEAILGSSPTAPVSSSDSPTPSPNSPATPPKTSSPIPSAKAPSSSGNPPQEQSESSSSQQSKGVSPPNQESVSPTPTQPAAEPMQAK